MHFSKVKVTREFEYHGLKTWLHAEVSLNEGEDAKDALRNANNLVEEYNAETLSEKNVPVIEQKKKLTGFEHWENEINKCTTIPKPDGIESLRMIADTNPKLKEVFNIKLKQLQNG